MTSLKRLLLVILAGLAGYAVTFAFIVKKPLTIGFIGDAYAVKAEYAATIHEPKIVILAGSNGLISHRCETIEALLARPCLNASITAELGLAYMLEIGKRFLAPGDVVLLPLEYAFYLLDKPLLSDRGHPYRVSYDHGAWGELSPLEIARALFQFDLRYLVGALVEEALSAAGIRRRFSRETLTVQGDLHGHTAEAAAAFRQRIATDPFWLNPAAEFHVTDAARQEITAFLRWASEHRITVVGALPTTFDDRPVEPEIVDQIAAVYRDAGQRFLLLPNRSQYPRSCFYDTQYHLIEECQVRHSQAVAEALKPFIAPP